MDVDIHFCRNLRAVLSRDADDILNFLLDARRIRSRQVNLIDNRHNLQPRVNRKIGVAQRLRLDTLRRVHNQQRAFARSQ